MKFSYYIRDRLKTYSILLVLLLITPRRRLINWHKLYIYTLFGLKGSFTAKDGTKIEQVSAYRLLRCLVITEYIYRMVRTSHNKRRISFEGQLMKVAVLNGIDEIKVDPDKIVIVSLPDLFREIYRNVDVRNKIVLNIGAYIGDSALYWLHEGAKKVMAIEPVPEHYEMLLLNSQGRSIIPINAAVGERVPLISKQVGLDTYGLCIPRKSMDRYLAVPVIGLLELVANWRPQVVQMNCEGCEYAVIEEIVQLPRFGVETLILQLHERGKRHSMGNALQYLIRYLGPPEITEQIVGKNPRITCIWRFKINP